MDSKWKTTVVILIILGFITAGSAPTRVIGCNDGSSAPSITIECDPGSTIRIIKGVCVLVSSCDAYDPSLESQCDNSDKTAQWAPYCAVTNPCPIAVSCLVGTTCQAGDNPMSYIYADYECISDETTVPTTLPNTAPGSTTGKPSPTPDFSTLHEPLPTMPSHVDIVCQKASLFKQIQGRRLMNHVIKTKHGLSLVKCGAECNKRGDCVSFNIGNGVCELNNRVVGGAGVSKDAFIKDEGYKYYEKQ